MSMPWWNEKNPGPSKPPARTPFSNTVRGSPKKPRIGCCLLNGLNGHGYADAPPAAASASTSTASTSRKERSMVTPQLWDARRTPRLALGARKPSRSDDSGPVVNAEPLRVGAVVAPNVSRGHDELVDRVRQAARVEASGGEPIQIDPWLHVRVVLSEHRHVL